MIFINYRQDDSKALVGRLHERLKAEFGADQVFVDVREIPAGSKWPQEIRDRLAKSKVMLAVIGGAWGKCWGQTTRTP